MIYLSIFSTILSSYCGFLFRLSIYLYQRKRLHYFERCVTLKLGNEQIENFGFKHITRMVP